MDDVVTRVARRVAEVLARSPAEVKPESRLMTMRAVSGCDRTSDEMDVSVLKRKCGLIWFARAETRAAISSFSCSWSRCSTRAVFQILMGVATASTVASMTSSPIQAVWGSK